MTSNNVEIKELISHGRSIVGHPKVGLSRINLLLILYQVYFLSIGSCIPQIDDILHWLIGALEQQK